MQEEVGDSKPKDISIKKVPPAVYDYICQKQLEFGRGKIRKPNLPNTVILIIKKLIK